MYMYFYAIPIYAHKYKYYPNIRFALSLLPSAVAIIAELGNH